MFEAGKLSASTWKKRNSPHEQKDCLLHGDKRRTGIIRKESVAEEPDRDVERKGDQRHHDRNDIHACSEVIPGQDRLKSSTDAPKSDWQARYTLGIRLIGTYMPMI